MDRKLNVGIYTRVSTQEQANDGYSIGEQKARLEKYADAHDWNIYDVYCDAGFSGGNTNRPSLNQLIDDVKRNKLDKVIVYKLDRLSRSQKDTLYLIEDVFLRNDCDFVSMTENFDTSTPLGRAMIGILSVFAQLEREQIKERMQVGLDARAKEGLFHGGGFAPIGYDYEDGKLTINEYEAMQIRKIYELFENGTPIHSIYKYMTNNYSTKFGKWGESGIRSCLNSIIYTGKITWKGEIYEGKHDAIISSEEFEKVQAIIKNRPMYKKRCFNHTTLLGGIIFCGNCGARYYCKTNSVKRGKTTDPDKKAQKYYTCYSRGKTSKKMIVDENCKNKTFNVNVLDEIILNEIEKLSLNPHMVDEIIKKNDRTNDKKIILDKIAKIDKQIEKLIDLYQLDGIDFKTIDSKIKKLGQEKDFLVTEFDSIESNSVSLTNRKELNEILLSFADIRRHADANELRRIVHSLINKIIIHDDSIEIHWNFN